MPSCPIENDEKGYCTFYISAECSNPFLLGFTVQYNQSLDLIDSRLLDCLSDTLNQVALRTNKGYLVIGPYKAERERTSIPLESRSGAKVKQFRRFLQPDVHWLKNRNQKQLCDRRELLRTTCS